MTGMTTSKRIALALTFVAVLFAAYVLIDIWAHRNDCRGGCPGTPCYEKCIKANYCPTYGGNND